MKETKETKGRQFLIFILLSILLYFFVTLFSGYIKPLVFTYTSKTALFLFVLIILSIDTAIRLTLQHFFPQKTILTFFIQLVLTTLFVVLGTFVDPFVELNSLGIIFLGLSTVGLSRLLTASDSDEE